MNPSRNRLRCWSILAAAAILAIGAGPATPAAQNDSRVLVVQDLTVKGDEVQLTVQNLAAETRSGRVVVRLPLADRVVEVVTRVAVPGGQKVFLVLRMPTDRGVFIPLGAVLDDGIPF